MGTGSAYCPHCFLEVASDVTMPWPPRLVRCSHCRLTIGSGRARETSEEAGPGSRGTAAGLLAHEARAAESTAGVEAPERVRDAIRTVAKRTGSRPERLLMLDYQRGTEDDDTLPPLQTVFATFGSWKRARRESAVA